MNAPAKIWIVEQLATSTLIADTPLGRLWRFVSRDIWRAEVERMGPMKRAFFRVCRIAFLTVRSFAGDRCVIRASALTYTTVLSLVPLLAFSFAILKGLGFYEDLRRNRIDPYLDELFGRSTGAAGGAQLRDGFDHVLNLVDRTNVQGLGAIGLGVLLLAALRLLSSVEASFNEIWGVRKSRSWVRQLSDYLTIVIVTPIFLVIAIGVTTAAQNAGVVDFVENRLSLGFALRGLIKLAPILIGWGAFTILYLVMPNRRTRLSSAALGGLVAGLAWQVALVVHIAFQVGVANYNAIYAGFAAFPIFLVWVQLSWLIVLFGAELAFAHENEREYHGFASYEHHAHAFREHLALRALTRICAAFLDGERPRTAASIAAGLGVSPREIDELLQDLVRGGLVAQVELGAGAGPGYMPARDPGRIAVVDVLEVLRGEGVDGEVVAQDELDRAVDRAMKKLDEEARSSAHNRSMREWVEDARRLTARESGITSARTSPQAP